MQFVLVEWIKYKNKKKGTSDERIICEYAYGEDLRDFGLMKSAFSF